jgi:hypothetical protein
MLGAAAGALTASRERPLAIKQRARLMPGLRDNAETRRIEIRWCSQPSCSRWEGSAERLAPPRRGRKGMDWALSGISLAILL